MKVSLATESVFTKKHISILEIVASLLIAFSLSVFVCFVSNNLGSRFVHRQETVDMQFAILHGEPYLLDGKSTYMPPFQNRILFPFILSSISRIRILSPSEWFLLVRLGSAIVLFLVAWWVFRTVIGASTKLTAFGMTLLAYSLVMTFNHGWEHTSDFPDAFFTLLIIVCSLYYRRWWLLLLSFAAATNRESAAFSGIIWLFVNGVEWHQKFKVRWREVGFAAMLTVLTYSCVLLLRYLFGGARALEGTQMITSLGNLIKSIGEFISHPTPSSWPLLGIAMVAPSLLWIWSNRKSLIPVHKRLLVAAFIITVASMVFGIVAELRIFIPTLVLITFVAVWSEISSNPSSIS